MRRQKNSSVLGKVLKIGGLVILAAIIVGVGYIVISGLNAEDANAAIVDDNTGVEVIRGSIKVTEEGTGKVKAVQTKPILSESAGKITRVYKKNGDSVDENEAVAEIINPDAASEIRTHIKRLNEIDDALVDEGYSETQRLKSPVTGYVKRLFCKEGDSVKAIMQTYGSLMEIAGDGKLKATISTDAELTVGESLRVRHAEEVATGTVQELKNGTALVVFPDSPYFPVNQEVAVYKTGGAKDGDSLENSVEIGRGIMTSNRPVQIVAVDGTVDNIYYEINDKVYYGNNVMALEVQGKDAYNLLVEEREEITEEIERLSKLETGLAIKAPRKGIVQDITVLEGMYIDKGIELFNVVQTDQFEVSIAASELDIANIEVGKAASITLDALEGREFAGTVSKIYPIGNTDKDITTYEVVIAITETEQIMLGMTANVKIVAQEKTDVLMLPVECIESDDQGKFVYKTAGTTVEKTYVEIGFVNNLNAEILSGLEEGDMVQKKEDLAEDMQKNLDVMMDLTQGDSSTAGDSTDPDSQPAEDQADNDQVASE